MKLNKIEQIKLSVKKAETQRKKLECGDVKFVMSPLFLFQKKLPDLMKRHKKQDARDAVVLYMYYCSLICRLQDHELYGCAFPDHDQITKGTGIHRTRIAKLNKILVDEKMIDLYKIPYNGHSKNVYVPLYLF